MPIDYALDATGVLLHRACGRSLHSTPACIAVAWCARMRACANACIHGVCAHARMRVWAVCAHARKGCVCLRVCVYTRVHALPWSASAGAHARKHCFVALGAGVQYPHMRERVTISLI